MKKIKNQKKVKNGKNVEKKKFHTSVIETVSDVGSMPGCPVIFHISPLSISQSQTDDQFPGDCDDHSTNDSGEPVLRPHYPATILNKGSEHVPIKVMSLNARDLRSKYTNLRDFYIKMTFQQHHQLNISNISAVTNPILTNH